MKKVIHHNLTFYGRTATIILDGGYGYVMVSMMKENPDIAIIHDLSVYKTKREKGLGDALLEEACETGKVMGAKYIMLSVVPGAWTESWYKRHGFTDIGKKETVFGVEHTVLEKKL